jgi:acyl carrier protein
VSKNEVNKVINLVISFFNERGKEIPSNDYDLFDNEIIDSMELLELIVLLESDLGIRINQEHMTVDNFRNVNQIVLTVIK